MMAALNSAVRWLTFIALVAIAAHVATVLRLPTYLAARTMERVVDAGGWNRFTPTQYPTPETRILVPPNPDYLISACAFNLAQNHMRLEASLPEEGEWTIALYDEQAKLFYSQSNATPEGRALRATLVPPASLRQAAEGEILLHAPSFTGLILVWGLPTDGVELAPPNQNYATCSAIPRM